MLFKELDILTDEPMREAGGDPSLVNGEAFLFEEDNLGEVLDVTFDGAFGMVSTTFNIGELIAGKVEVQDLGLVSLSTAEFVTPSSGRDDDAFLSQEAHVTFYGDYTGGEYEGNVFVGEDTTLLDGFVGYSDDLMLPQSMQS